MVEYSQVALVGLLIYPLTAEVVFKMYNYASTRHSHVKNKCILLFFSITVILIRWLPEALDISEAYCERAIRKKRACFKRHDCCQV